MALTSSGQIKLSQIAAEFGGSAPHALSEYHGKGNAPGSGEIELATDFYGTSNSLAVSTSFTQCYDAYANLYYNGNGSVIITSHEPSGSIHTGRGDCSCQQGTYTRYSFNASTYSTINITVSASGRGGSGSRTINQSSSSTWGPTQVGAWDGAGGAACYSFSISGTVGG
jgi:hypothetical protein